MALFSAPCTVIPAKAGRQTQKYHFYDPLFAFLSGMVAAEFLHVDQLSQLIISEDPQEVIKLLVSTKPRLFNKWLDRKNK